MCKRLLLAMSQLPKGLISSMFVLAFFSRNLTPSCRMASDIGVTFPIPPLMALPPIPLLYIDLWPSFDPGPPGAQLFS